MRSSHQKILSIAVLVAASFNTVGIAQEEKPTPKKKRPANAAFAKIKDNSKLPRVLLIGDSISIGYTVATRELLKGKANLHRIPTNGGPTTRGLESLEDWLGTGKWDVIHFNWGLHDLKYINDKKQLVAKGKGLQQVSLEDYEQNLKKLVKQLKNTGAKLIWCSTTPVPEGAAGRVMGDAVKYNAVAANVMQEENVSINDLYSFANEQLETIQRPANVHFSPAGSKVLAKQVAEKILDALQK